MSKNRKQVHNTLSFYSGMDIIVANYPQLEAECAGNRFVIAWAGRLSVIIHCPQPRLLGSLDNGEANLAPLLQSRITNMDIMCSYFLRVMSVLPVATQPWRTDWEAVVVVVGDEKSGREKAVALMNEVPRFFFHRHRVSVAKVKGHQDGSFGLHQTIGVVKDSKMAEVSFSKRPCGRSGSEDKEDVDGFFEFCSK